MLPDSDLLKYNQQGLIPGPAEEEAAFVQRAWYCQNIKTKLEQTKAFPFEYLDVHQSLLPEKAWAITCSLYDIKPSWIPVTINNHQLAPWHGGCAWIFQLDMQSPTSAFLQLRKGQSLFYEHAEIMAHECAHIGRMQFDEPLFEELLAYQSSPKAWRRWLGPLVQSPRESLFFCALILAMMFFDLYVLAFDQQELISLSFWLKGLPLLAILAAGARLLKRHATFNTALRNLTDIVASEKKARAILYRLTDSEIILFAKLSAEHILKHAQQQNCLRWRLIKLAYLQTGVNENDGLNCT